MIKKLALLTTVLATTLQASVPSGIDYADKFAHTPHISPQRTTTPVGMEGFTSFSLGDSLDTVKEKLKNHPLSVHADPKEVLKEVVQLANQYLADDEKQMTRQGTMGNSPVDESPLTPWSPVPMTQKEPLTHQYWMYLHYEEDEKGMTRQETMCVDPVTIPVTQQSLLSHQAGWPQPLKEEASLKRAFRAEQPSFPPSPCHTPMKLTKHVRSYSVVSADGSNEGTPRRSSSSLTRRSPLGLSGFVMK